MAEGHDPVRATASQRPWAALRAPFPEDQLELKPQPLSRADQDKGRCEAGDKYSADGMFCGGWHVRAIHLTYVGHAGVTDRLNEVCGEENWSLEPLALGPDGLPVIRNGQLWVRLTIWGVTKIEVGDADGRGGYEEGKVIWSDALKRAAMRFGIGTYLWSKSDKAKALIERTDPEPVQQRPSQQKNGQPSDQMQAQEQDPWKTDLNEDEQKTLSGLMREENAQVLRRAWKDAETAERRFPHLAVRPDVDIARDAADLLGVREPMPLKAFVGLLGKHLTEEGFSVREHLRLNKLPADQTGQSVPDGDGDATA